MEHGLELIIGRLEIFGNLIFYIFSYPGNIGNLIFLIFSYPGNTGNMIFQFSHILEILEIGFFHFPISWKYWKYCFPISLDFFKKDARRNFTQNAPVNGPRSLI